MLIALKEGKIIKYSIPFLIFCLIVNAYLTINPQLEEILFQRNTINKEKELIKQIPKNEEVLITTDEFDGSIFNIYDEHKNLKIMSSEDIPENGYKEYNVMGNLVRLTIYIKEDTFERIYKDSL